MSASGPWPRRHVENTGFWAQRRVRRQLVAAKARPEEHTSASRATLGVHGSGGGGRFGRREGQLGDLLEVVLGEGALPRWVPVEDDRLQVDEGVAARHVGRRPAAAARYAEVHS